MSETNQNDQSDRNNTTENTDEQPRKRGGGPRTPEGKRRSSLNARRHAITARVHVATPEESAVFDAHLKAYLEALAPVGVVERDLAIEIADLKFRLKRAGSVEHAIFALGHETHAEAINSGHPQADAALAEGLTWIREAKRLQLLTLYEARIRKAVEKNTAELERLQKERKEAYARAQRQAIQLVKVAVSEGHDYEAGGDFQPASAHGQFVFSTSELARVIHRQNRLDRSYALPDLEAVAA
jgi:hypothetical protein